MLNLHHNHHHHHHPPPTPPQQPPQTLHSLHLNSSKVKLPNKLWVVPHNKHLQNPTTKSHTSLFKPLKASFEVSHNSVPLLWANQDEEDDGPGCMDNLAQDSEVYKSTLRLVECSMFAAVSGLTYLLSNSLAIENYFGCFFALPIVISSMRWGVAAGRKTMVATAVLLLVLSGPVKALTYVLMHGLLGFTMGSLWRLQVRWSLSIFLCTLVRAIGALGYVLTSSFLIRENILALITINVHASLTFIFNSLGFNTVPSMNLIYAIFGTLLLLNCCFFVFLLHVLYALFLTRLGMKSSLTLPRWLVNAL